MFSVWLLLVKPINRIDVEFLPVYIPNEEECQEPALFAKNVQKVMAKKLDLYASDDTYYAHYKEYCKQLEAKEIR